MSAAAAAVLVEVLEASGLEWDRVDEHRWTTMLSGEWKRTIPVLFDLDEHSLKVQSLFCGVPDEGHREVYELVLHRNERARWVHFALDDEGDVLLVGRLPHEVVTPDVLGEVLGEVLAVSDASYNAVLRAGFATYIEREQEWRSLRGLPRNPVSDA